MATVKPFRALRYDEKNAGAPMSALVCPPYDVIDGAMQDALYQRSHCNVVRVEYGKTLPEDQPGSDRYSRAAATLADWVAGGVLKRDPRPAFYLYEQTFDPAGGDAGGANSQWSGLSVPTIPPSGLRVPTTAVRRGIFGAVRLEPFGTGCVYPHEETFGAPKADRLSLMRACSANLSPVFGLVPDEDGVLTALLAQGVALKKPDVELTEDSGTLDRLWAIDDPDWCVAIERGLGPKNIFIADGHHRYETCCNFRDERRQAEGDPAGKTERDCDYTLMMCVPMSDPGLRILPTHRLIQAAPGISEEGFLNGAAAYFTQREASEKELLALAEGSVGWASPPAEDCPVQFGAIFKSGSRRILTLKPGAAQAMKAAAPGKSEAWRALDVSVLQELVLKGILKLSEEKVLRKEGISYTPVARQALARVTAPESPYGMGFILRPTLIEQVRAVAAGGEKMPQKSTYFYPKLLTGLVIRTV